MFEKSVIVVGAGQSGLAAAHHLLRSGLRPILVDASDDDGGAWPHYYDSLTLFSPAQFSSLPGLTFPGDPHSYPSRDAVIDYLYAYRRHLGVEVMRGRAVEALRLTSTGFAAVGMDLHVEAPRAIVATGSFRRPYVPSIVDAERFQGDVFHSAGYRAPHMFADQRVAVIGGGNSAIQIAHELSTTAEVTLFTRRPIRWQPQRIFGRDVHWWLTKSGLDRAGWSNKALRGVTPVVYDGRYRRAIRAGRIRRRAMFDAFAPDGVRWQSGERQQLDSVVFATGFRPDASILEGTTALDASGGILHTQGVSDAVPGLGFVGVPNQRNFASATLRGVGADARHVIDVIAGTRPRFRGQSTHGGGNRA